MKEKVYIGKSFLENLIKKHLKRKKKEEKVKIRIINLQGKPIIERI